MSNCLDSSLNFINQRRRRVEHEEVIRPLSTNKWSQYQMDRWFRSFSASHTKPKLRSQVQGTFVPNLSSHQSAEEMADRESE